MLAIGAVVALALLAGAADRSGGGGEQIPVPREPLVVAAQTVFWLLIASAIGYLVLMIWALITDPSPIVAQPRRKRSLLSYLMLLAPALLMAVILYQRRPGAPANSLLGRFGLGAVPPAPPGQGNGLAGPDTLWISLIIASVIAGVFLAWLFWPAPRKPRPRPQLVTQGTKQPVAEAVDDTVDALHAIADPRQAIIAAYSAMEASLRRAGVRRKRSDTPIEFLARALSAVLGASNDAGRLTYLFEFAKFSPHDVDESMRAEALRALLNIRAQVTASVAT